ncbi:MAG TPA: hypothetical protein VF119_03345, partial [Candidatus Limnocylindrales bacterium]
IMGKAWDRIGVGAYKGPTGKKMWTVIFADKCGTSTPKPTAKPTPKPTAKPRATAKPAARATPKPTPRPTPRKTASPAKAAATPAPTPTVVETADPLATAPLDEGDLLPSDEPEPEPADDDGSTDSTTPASQEPPDETEGDGAVGMRVVDDGGTDGLLESIVGGVAGLFFGG